MHNQLGRVKFKSVYAWVLLLVVLPLSSAAEPSAITEPSAISLGLESSVDIKPYLSWWSAPENLSIEEVSLPSNASNFKPYKKPVLELDKAIWYRFEVYRPPGNSDRFFLNFNESLYDELFVFERSTSGWLSHKGGLLYAYDERSFESRQLVFPLVVPEGEAVNIYFRLKTSAGNFFHPRLESEDGLYKSMLLDNAISMFSIGLVFGIIAYMCFLMLLTSDKQKLLACIFFVLSAFAMMIFYNGYLYPLFNYFPEHQGTVYLLLLSAMVFWGCFFIRAIVVADAHFRSLVKVLNWTLFALLLIPAYALIGNYQNTLAIQLLLNVLFPILLLVLAAVAAYKRKASAIYYFLAVLSYTGILMFTVLTVFNVVEYNFLTRHLFELATISLGIFLCVAITNSAYYQRRQQQEFAQLARDREVKDQAKSEFLAAMSHEIRTPINGILGMAQMLQRTRLDKTQRYYSDVIVTAGKTLLNIINDILDFSKIEAGKLELVDEPFNLGEMIAQTSILFGSSRKSDEVDFELRSDAEIPLWLSGDRIRLQQVIDNLLSNAFKFTERGGVEFSVSLEDWLSPEKVRLKFQVEDTGIGISRDLMQRLFSPYSQADSSTTRKFGGTGLGLSISRQLVRLMGGEIGVDSDLGKGSRFWFCVDFDVVEEKQRKLLSDRLELQGVSVALVLSESKSREVIGEHLLEWGMNVTGIDNLTLPSEFNFSKYDVLVLGSSVKPPFEEWLAAADENQTPVLLLNPINDTLFQGEKFQRERVHYLKMPASLTQLQYALLNLLAAPETGEVLTVDDVELYPDSTLHELIVLVAEDNLVNLKVVEALLKSLKIEASFAQDGQATVDSYCANPERYDVILMDCEMPVMDGFEATRQIRAFEQSAALTPVFICALTAHALDDIAGRCMSAGMDDVLIKPLDLQKLTERLRRCNPRGAGKQA